MLFVFTLKSRHGDADMVIPALCNGPDHAKARAREVLAKHPGRQAIEVAHRGRLMFRCGAPPEPARPALEL